MYCFMDTRGKWSNTLIWQHYNICFWHTEKLIVTPNYGFKKAIDQDNDVVLFGVCYKISPRATLEKTGNSTVCKYNEKLVEF